MNSADESLAWKLAHRAVIALEEIAGCIGTLAEAVIDNRCETCGSLARNARGERLHTSDDCVG